MDHLFMEFTFHVILSCGDPGMERGNCVTLSRARHKDMIKPIKPPERTFGFGGLIMNKEFKSKCLFFLMVGFKVLLSHCLTNHQLIEPFHRKDR